MITPYDNKVLSFASQSYGDSTAIFVFVVSIVVLGLACLWLGDKKMADDEIVEIEGNRVIGIYDCSENKPRNYISDNALEEKKRVRRELLIGLFGFIAGFIFTAAAVFAIIITGN